MIAPRRRQDPRALYHSVAVYSNGLVTVEVWEPVSDWELPPREGGRLWGWTSRRLLRGGGQRGWRPPIGLRTCSSTDVG